MNMIEKRERGIPPSPFPPGKKKEYEEKQGCDKEKRLC